LAYDQLVLIKTASFFVSLSMMVTAASGIVPLQPVDRVMASHVEWDELAHRSGGSGWNRKAILNLNASFGVLSSHTRATR
jgi:hypothetical protein